MIYVITIIKNSKLLIFIKLFTITMGLISPLNASDWQMKVIAMGSHLAYTGGDYNLFLEITDSAGNYIRNLSTDNVSLKVNEAPHLYTGFSDTEHLEHRIALLYGNNTSLTSKHLQLIKDGFSNFIQNKRASDEVFIQFNGAQKDSSILQNQDALMAHLKEIPGAFESTMSDADFLIQATSSIISSEKRHWVVFIVSDTETLEEEQATVLKEILANHQLSLIPIVINNSETPHWTEQLEAPITSTIFKATSPQEIPEILQSVSERIKQEYVLSYQLNHFGNSPHEVEIQFTSQQGIYKIHHTFEKVPIWSQPPPNLLIAWGLGILLLAGLIGWMRTQPKPIHSIDQPGFQIMTPGENFQFIPLDQETYNLDFLSSIKTNGNLRLSANLGKVILTSEQSSYFLEDKNYKNALLINRRRVRRTLLRHGDVLDIGELTLIYLNKVTPTQTDVEEVSDSPEIPIYYDRPQGPIRKKIGMLVNEANRQEYYLTKNITFIGRSKSNNLVLDSRTIALRHAKIIRVGVQYKLQSLSSNEGSFVNRRRIEQRFLRDGDELSFDTCRFRFRIVHNSPSRSDREKGGYHS